MDLLASLFAGSERMQPGPTDDFWYGPIGAMTQAGLRVDEEGAKKISAWFRGRDILSTSLAMLPLPIYRRLPSDQGRDKAPTQPLYDVLHRKPNSWQDSFQWRRQAMCHLIDHGNHYSRIVAGPRGFADQLHPIADPRTVTPELLGSGRKVFHIRDAKTGATKTKTQDEVFHLCGASDDGVVGKGILEYARESLGLGLALHSYASRLFSQGVLHGGVITVPGTLDPEAARRMAASFVTSASKWHSPKVLEQGATYAAAGLDPEKAQFILSRKFSVNDIARWLGLPPHMLADLERSTNNNIEHQGQEFVDYSLGPWLTLWEFAINDQLMLRPETYFAEFTRDALVRGDIATRWAAYVSSVNAGIVAINEVRTKENLTKVPGGDVPREPKNITGSQSFPNRDRRPEPREDRAQAIATEAAARLLRKEIRAIQQRAVKHAADGDAFASAVTGFYADHVALVAQTLQVDQATAHTYCRGQAAQILGEVGLSALETWAAPYYAAGLAAWALDGDEEAA